MDEEVEREPKFDSQEDKEQTHLAFVDTEKKEAICKSDLQTILVEFFQSLS